MAAILPHSPFSPLNCNPSDRNTDQSISQVHVHGSHYFPELLTGHIRTAALTWISHWELSWVDSNLCHSLWIRNCLAPPPTSQHTPAEQLLKHPWKRNKQKNVHPHLASPQLDGHYLWCLPLRAVNSITASLLLQVVGFSSDKPKGICCPGILSTTTISAIIKEQLVFDLAWIKRWRTELSCGATTDLGMSCRER